MDVQYPYDSLKRDQNITQSPYRVNEHSQISHALRQEWYPCSEGYSLRSYISCANNGPFFRPLLIRWQKLGCPSLSCLKGKDEIITVQNVSDQEQDEPWMNGSIKNDLLTLCISQEKVVTQAMKALDDNLLSFEKMIKKPFDSFAAQVGLYSSIEAELNNLESDGDLDLTQLYQNAWQRVLNQFDSKRKGSCASRQDHKCLLDAIWGEACQWPLKALQYAFLGYTLALPKLDQELPLEQSQNSNSSNPNTISNSSSVMEYDYQLSFRNDGRLEDLAKSSLGLEDVAYPVSTSTKQSENIYLQDKSLLSTDNSLQSKPWLRKSFQELLFSSEHPENRILYTNEEGGGGNLNKVLPAAKKVILEQRRPTLSDFWRFGGMPGMFHLPELTPQIDVNESQDYFGFSTNEDSGNQSTDLTKSPEEQEGGHTTSSPIRAQLQQSLSESQISTKTGLGILRQSPTRFESSPQRPALRARAATLIGERTLPDYSTEILGKKNRTGEMENKRRQKRVLGRQRYQRYYKRTMLQRQAMQRTIEQVKMEVENSLIDEMKENIKNILNTPGKTQEELLAEYYSGLRTDSSTKTFDHKRMSKIRLRNNDLENITTISRLAKVIEEVPLNQLIKILNSDQNSSQDGEKAYATPAINALLEAFMSQRDEWSVLIAAEWRLLNGTTSSLRRMVKLLSLATDEEAPPDLNEESEMDNDEEDVY